MKNLVEHYDRVGASYIAEIPGNAGVSNAPENNGAHFTGDDLVVICANNAINYSFAATDKDGDKLLYSFCGLTVSHQVASDGMLHRPARLLMHRFLMGGDIAQHRRWARTCILMQIPGWSLEWLQGGYLCNNRVRARDKKQCCNSTAT